MTIHIVPDGPSITLSESEYARLLDEYRKYTGPWMTFEDWLRSNHRKSSISEERLIGPSLLNERS